MTLKELESKFEHVNETYSSSVQLHIAGCQCNADIKYALDEIARQTFYAIAETQAAIIQYLKQQN